MLDPSDPRYTTGLLAALTFGTDYAAEGLGSFAEGVQRWHDLQGPPSNVVYLDTWRTARELA
jgi:hypothetical protein